MLLENLELYIQRLEIEMVLRVLVTLFTLLSTASAQVNVGITDGQRQFAEGILDGYFVQSDGRTICANPYVIGRYISCEAVVTDNGITWRAGHHDQVWADTNGVLGGMVVIDSNGTILCSDPTVSVHFRGPESYIVCQ
jgi:hypothetical protein